MKIFQRILFFATSVGSGLGLAVGAFKGAVFVGTARAIGAPILAGARKSVVRLRTGLSNLLRNDTFVSRAALAGVSGSVGAYVGGRVRGGQAIGPNGGGDYFVAVMADSDDGSDTLSPSALARLEHGRIGQNIDEMIRLLRELKSQSFIMSEGGQSTTKTQTDIMFELANRYVGLVTSWTDSEVADMSVAMLDNVFDMARVGIRYQEHSDSSVIFRDVIRQVETGVSEEDLEEGLLQVITVCASGTPVSVI
jgi:hypothetical protein